MSSNPQLPSSSALLHPPKPNTSTPTSVKPSHESIGSDFSSLEVISQAIHSSRSAPSSPKRIHRLIKRSKTIEELRQEILALKGNNQSSATHGQRREALESGPLINLEKMSQSCCFSEDSVDQAINEALHITNNQLERKLMFEGKSGEAADTGDHPSSSGSHYEAGELMLGGEKDGNRDVACSRGYQAAVDRSCNPTKTTPFQEVHGNMHTAPSGNYPHKGSGKDRKGDTKLYPLDNSAFPAGINQVSPPISSNVYTLPPNTPKVKSSADLENFPPLNAIKASLDQPGNTCHPNPLNTLENPNKTSDSTWATLFNSNRIKSNGLPLEYVNESSSISTEQNPCISVTIDEVHDELIRWSNALVGYVIGAKPPYKLMKQFTESKWKSFGHVETLVLRSGLFLFNFENAEVKQKVMELGPWSYFDKPLILKPWSSNCSYEKEEISTIPIWVRFPFLKLHLWSAKILSKLSSQIGQPLFSDKMTATKQRLAYARVCIEVSPAAELPKEITIIDHDGSSYLQPVEYEWTPKVCKVCKSINHGTNSCPKSTKMEWKPKVTCDKVISPKVQVNSLPQAKELHGDNSALIIDNSFAALADVGPSHSNKDKPSESPPRIVNAAPTVDNFQVAYEGPSNIEEPAFSGADSEAPPLSVGIVDGQGKLNTVSAGNVDQMEITESNINEDNSLNLALCEAENWEIMLSKSQRKKRGKMLHAISLKEKASEAKHLAQLSPK